MDDEASGGPAAGLRTTTSEADPAGGIGASAPARRWQRLVAGRGRYLADLSVRGMREAVFIRSPVAHAEIERIDATAARAHPGIDAVYTWADIKSVLSAWRGAHALFPDLIAPWQTALADQRVRHVGEPVAILIGESRAVCEDAAELVDIDYAPLPAIVDPEAALAPGAPAIHPEADGNLCLRMTVASDGLEEAFDGADAVVEATFRFGRHTGVPLEPRGLVADFEPADRRLVVHHSHQCPAAMQDAFARFLGIDEHKVRIVCPDVGGAFGIKQQVHADEMAVAAASVLLGRPVRFVADRLESMASDIQARHHIVKARLAAGSDGRLRAIEADDIFAIGPYSQYPRSSVGEGRAMLTCTGAPYDLAALGVTSRVVFTNLGMAGHYRGVGHPIATAVTEGLVDLAARRVGIDPFEIRRRNLLPLEAFPYTSPAGVTFEALPYRACLDALAEAVPPAELDGWRTAARARGVLAGYGLSVFVEMTTRGPAFYGDGEVRVSARDGCTLQLEPSGLVRGTVSVTEQGQGVETGVAQVVASTLGVPLDAVELLTGDTAVSVHAGGTWGSRSLAAGGRAAWEAARDLKAEILELAGLLLQTGADTLDIAGGSIVEREGGRVRLSLADFAATCHFRPHHLPAGRQPRLVASAAFGPVDAPFRAGCGVQLSAVEIDRETGIVRPVRHAIAHACGTIVNPLIVDGQLSGGVVQGIGAAISEELAYGPDGQLLSGTLADYRLPMAGEMPDVEIVHVPLEPGAPAGAADADDGPRFTGVGEAGTAGAAGAVLNAINDALAPAGAALWQTPATPARVLAALGVIDAD